MALPGESDEAVDEFGVGQAGGLPELGREATREQELLAACAALERR